MAKSKEYQAAYYQKRKASTGSQSEKIYNQILEQGLNSKIQGIRNKAMNGTGNYNFKNASPAPYEQAKNMQSSTMKALTRGENTLVDGLLPNGQHVYYAGKTESKEIQSLLDKRKSKADTTSNIPDNVRTTSTYDRWYKANRRKFDSYYNASKGKS